jgi:hypothetical protein
MIVDYLVLQMQKVVFLLMYIKGKKEKIIVSVDIYFIKKMFKSYYYIYGIILNMEMLI